jgi:FecR protein
MHRNRSQIATKAAILAGVTLLAASAVIPALAQDADDVQRGVARISIMDGQVSVKRGDAGEWVGGVINAPLMSDDSIATAPNSRAEVQFDSSNLIRIGGNAQIHLTTLEADRYQMELGKGTLTYRILRPSNTNSEVDTPSISVRPSKSGIYRISVNDNGETQLTVRSGDVEVFTPKGSQWVSQGQTMLARGTSANPEFQMQGAIGMDDWDRWNDSRDQALMQAAAAYQHVPPGVYGVEDMQGQGNWVDTPDYGQVWQPTVAAGWAPYSCGRWVWADWYGWTWVDCASWGWAPFHYGRWFNRPGFGWLWYPGVIGVRHYWSPGLVAFFGYGGGFGFGFGFGNVGWVPLAPYEVFHPWWGRGFYGAGFASRVSVTNINVFNSYRNARVLNGVSGVTAAGFRGGQFGAIGHVSGDQIRSAGLVRGQMPIGPSAANLHYGASGTAFRPASAGASHFFSHQQPAVAQHMAVTQPLRNESAAGVRGTGANVGGERFGGQAARPEQNGASGGRSFGTGAQQPAGQWGGRQNAGMQNTRPGGSAPTQAPRSEGTWHNFGAPSAGGRGASGGAPRGEGFSPQPRSNGSEGGRPESMRISPPVVHERSSSPGYNAPRQSAPGYSAPRQAPNYSAPRQSAPGYSAPRQSAPSYSAPRSGGGGGGGGGRPSGGGGHSGGSNHHR